MFLLSVKYTIKMNLTKLLRLKKKRNTAGKSKRKVTVTYSLVTKSQQVSVFQVMKSNHLPILTNGRKTSGKTQFPSFSFESQALPTALQCKFPKSNFAFQVRNVNPSKLRQYSASFLSHFSAVCSHPLHTSGCCGLLRGYSRKQFTWKGVFHQAYVCSCIAANSVLQNSAPFSMATTYFIFPQENKKKYLGPIHYLVTKLFQQDTLLQTLGHTPVMSHVTPVPTLPPSHR